MLVLSSTVCEIFTVEMCFTLAMTFRMSQISDVNMPMELMVYATFYFLAMAQLAIMLPLRDIHSQNIHVCGLWPWKSESAKEFVTTHQPNQLALKMEGASASGPYRTVAAVRPSSFVAGMPTPCGDEHTGGRGVHRSFRREPRWIRLKCRSWW